MPLVDGVPILALLATIGLLDGFADADTAPPRVEPGRTVETAPLGVSAHEARVRKLPWDDFPPEDHEYLLVRATVESRAEQPLDESTLIDALR